MKNNRPLFCPIKIATLTLLCWFTQKTGCIDYQEKMARAEKLVTEAALFFNKTTRNQACREFTYNERWQDGPFTIFVDDIAGNRLVSHNYLATIWETDLNLKNLFGKPAFPLMLEEAKKGGGWIPIFILNSLAYTYVTLVEKNKRKYIIGTVFFCDDEPDLICRILLKAIQHYWYEKNNTFDVFEFVSNSLGPCIMGDISGTIIDTNGICWANGKNTLLIGKNLLDPSYSDAPIFKKIIDFVKTNQKNLGLIKTRINKNIQKIYFKKIIDPQTKKIFIILTGYCPTINKDVILHMTEKIKKTFKTHAQDTILNAINDIGQTKDTLYAKNNCLDCMVLNQEYTVLAYSKIEDSFLIDRNYLTYVDQKERAFVQLIKSQIDAEGKGWATCYSHNMLERIYAEKIETQSEPVIILIRGYYPRKRPEIASILVDDAYRHLLVHPEPKSLKIFLQSDSPFIKGDMQISLYDTNGFCWISGLNKEAIWSRDKTWPQARQGWVDDRRTNNTLKRFKKNIGPILSNINEEFMLGTTYFEDSTTTRFSKNK